MQIEQARHVVLHGQAQGEAPAPWLQPEVERSWRRCLSMGLEPDQPVAFDSVTAAAMRQATEENRNLLRAAAPVVRSLSRAMLHSQYFALLTDAQGVVIDVQGPVDRSNHHVAAIARVGVDLSERAVGTTAIGTTLSDLAPVWLHRGEHFFRDTSIFSCAGAPIWGPDGRCVGMLDLTGVNVQEQPALKHLVTQSARSIENALTLATPHSLLLRLNWPTRVLGDDNDGLVCMDEDGMITGINRPATELLGQLQLPAKIHCTEVFAISPGQLFDDARQHKGPQELPLWSGLRLQVLAQQHERHARSTLSSSAPAVPLRDVETALIRKAVDDARGNVMDAARALGISRATVYRKLGRKKPGSGA
ncbi:MAG: helix-turn-helix domain-containing protein [Burkholderiaceae bacterium]